MPELSHEPRALRALVSGVVQGVGYRWTARRLAERLGLAGWIGNLPDGRVEAFVQGAADEVDEFVRWLQEGPRGARVTGVEIEWVAVDPMLASFTIR